MQSIDRYALIDLQVESQKYQGKSGTSEELYCYSFFPAFHDLETDRIFLSKYANGEPASCHVLDGLPDDLILARDADGQVIAVKASIKSGFVRHGVFYSRDEVVRALKESA